MAPTAAPLPMDAWDNLNPLNPNWPFPPNKKAPNIIPGQPDIGKNIPNPGSVVGGIQDLGKVAADIVSPNWWLRVGEFLIGGILLTVGVGAMLKAPQAVRKGARASERTARVAYSVTPQGSRVSKAAQSVARTARRSRA